MKKADSKKVSIVLPVYNGAATISEAIDSILRQTYSDFELIIVNDCSSDKTEDIVNEYAKKDSRILIINNTVNQKLPKSLNIGFEHANGVYYTWTSDDNMYKQEAIQKMVECLDADDSIGMVYTNYTVIDEKGDILHEVITHQPEMIPYGNVVGACFLYRNSVAEKVGGYDTTLFLAEDYDYWIRVFKVSKLVHLDDNLYYYRWHNRSLTATKKELIGWQTYKALEKNFLFLYSLMDCFQKRNDFFDHIMSRVGNNEEVKQILFQINKSYRWYREICRVKKKMLALMRKLINKIVK